ncbi:MAG: phosphatidate cytidylyltransferase [Bacteroides sp.]|nr:phosphatidate cytidylyltransferase [Bacillota bacterium]MCM1394028.1 phosphatidate cytidylyltransferase [[Eubacterium] siraeum]MCM1455796.1 phosphatidate cytidylyltransferase [Bacteroides sp.]
MLKRTLTGITLVIILAAFMLCGYFVSPIFIDMLILIFLAGSVYEMRKCFKETGYDMYVLPSIVMLICAYPAFYLMQRFIGKGAASVSAGVQGLLIVLLVSVMLCLSIFTFRPLMKKRGKSSDCKADAPSLSDNADETAIDNQSDAAGQVLKGNLNDLLANVFIIVYPMLFLSAAWILSYKYSAIFAVLFAIFVPIIGSDTFAYFVGSLIGGKKLCPSISPKKTVAGAVGGLIGGMVVAILFWVVFEYVGSIAPTFAEGCNYVPFISRSDGGWMWKSALIYLAIGLICGAISEIGDLAASSIKRAIGIKDYGKIFPGHGGFMDRIDSVMYCLVVLLIAFTCIYGH